MHPSEAIERLVQAGLSETDIAGRVGANQSTINRIRRGQMPKFDLGKALIDLAATDAPGDVAVLEAADAQQPKAA